MTSARVKSRSTRTRLPRRTIRCAAPDCEHTIVAAPDGGLPDGHTGWLVVWLPSGEMAGQLLARHFCSDQCFTAARGAARQPATTLDGKREWTIGVTGHAGEEDATSAWWRW